MELTPKILFGRVMHKRFFPKVNAFNYGIYYLGLPLSKIDKSLENKYFKINRWGLLSFYNKDHGNRDGSDLKIWAHKILKDHGVDKADGEIVLVAMPRVFGYVFNPISLWYCYDKAQKLRAVICEVNNTFGETHSYICAHNDQSEIGKDDILEGQKVFHVSPFLEREGHYKFRFSLPKSKMGAWIDYYDESKRKKLVTALSGDFIDLSVTSCGRAFWRYPLVTIKSISLIHWQALKLLFRRATYVSKPLQKDVRVTTAKTSNRKQH